MNPNCQSKASRIGAGVLAAALLVTSLGNSLVAWAEFSQTEFLNPKVTYSDDNKTAEITFDPNSINRDVYNIVSITSNKDGALVYNKATEKAVYQTSENGTYDFTVVYTEKQQPESTPIASEEAVSSQPEQSTLPQQDETSQPAQEEVAASELVETESNQESANDQAVAPATLEIAPEDVIVDESEQGIQPEEPVANADQPQTLEEPVEAEPINVEKATIVTVTVDGIAGSEATQQPEQIKPTQSTQSTEDEDIPAGAIPIETIEDAVEGEDGAGSEMEQSIDFTDAFDITGRVSNGDGSSNINSRYYSVNGNSFTLGNMGIDFRILQTLDATTKYKVDLRRPFIIEGSVDYEGKAEGFAIALHRGTTLDGENFAAKNGGGSMGIYKDVLDGSVAENNGIYQGVVMEVDGFNNKTSYGDDKIAPENMDEEGRHIAIQTTTADGTVAEIKDVAPMPEAGDGKRFKAEWTPQYEGTKIVGFHLSFTYNGVTVESNFDPNLAEDGNDIVDSHAVITFAAGISKNYATKPTVFTLNKITYNDLDLEIIPEITPLDEEGQPTYQNYVMPGQRVQITYKGRNKIETSYAFELTTLISLEELKLVGKQQQLQFSSVKGGADLSDAKDYTNDFNTKNSIEVPILSNSAWYYVRFIATVPDDAVAIGGKDRIAWKFKLGNKGMSQYEVAGGYDVMAQPELFVKNADGQKVTGSDSIKIPDEAQINEDVFWKSLHAKASNDGTDIPLINGQSEYDNFKVSTDYTIGGKSVGSTYPSDQIKDGSIVTFTVTVTDNTTGATNTFTRVVTVGENGNSGTDESGNKYFINAVNPADVTETKLASLGTSDKFKDYLLAAANVQVIKLSRTARVSVVDPSNIEIPEAEAFVNGTKQPQDTPHPVIIQCTLGEKIFTTVQQKITANPWSYEEDNQSTEDGVAGFILIPKSVNLTADLQSGKVSGIAKVSFSKGYTAATNVAYRVQVPEKFELIFQDGGKTALDTPENLTVKTSVAGVESSSGTQGILDVGTLSLQNSTAEVRLDLEKKTDVEEVGIWEGQMTFYFTRTTVETSTAKVA